MSSALQPTAPAHARVTRRGRFSLIWLIPIVTVLIGGWLAWDTLSKRGPTITIAFDSGEGLLAGQSHIKHKDVDLGLVTKVALSPDASHVLVTAQMSREAIPFLTNQAKFWVVTPRLFAGRISGLDTLISGSYIELLPSSVSGEKSLHFTGLENPQYSPPTSRAVHSCCTRTASALSVLARPCSSAASMSAPCSDGISAIWQRT